MEHVLAIARALACQARLNILRVLVMEGELPASRIADACHMTRPVASKHLRALAAPNILVPRRSGPRILYDYSQAPRVSLGTRVNGAVIRAFEDPRWALRGRAEKRIGHVAIEQLPPIPKRTLHTMDVIFDAASAFANIRRLQILQRLIAGEGLTLVDIQRQLHMSNAAATRHVQKLRRRGYVCRGEDEHTLGLVLCKSFSSQFHEALLSVIKPALAEHLRQA